MLYTIGYEGATLNDFISTLQLVGVDVLVDIRDRAQSRRAGFSKSALSEALETAGIRYLHLKQLGDPKEGREAARRGDFAEFQRVFAHVMVSHEALTALNVVKELLVHAEVCLMCYERDVRNCHRKIVSDSLTEGAEILVKHIGVVNGAGIGTVVGRVHDNYQGPAASL